MTKISSFLFMAFLAIQIQLPNLNMAMEFLHHAGGAGSSVMHVAQSLPTDAPTQIPSDMPSEEDSIEELVSMEQMLNDSHPYAFYSPFPILGSYALVNDSPVPEPYTRGLHRPPDLI